MSETYLFMSHPRAVETRRKYRAPAELEDELGNTANLMFDPRVMRGVTCGRPMPVSELMQASATLEQHPRLTKKQLVRMGKIRPSQQSVAEIHEGIRVEKKRVEVPLHLYLIEQEEQKHTVTVSSQTDAFLEEPPSPKYIPAKRGNDMGAQVDVDEVFEYDKDVAPILEVVISKTMEQSLMEVRQEEELKSIARSKGYLESKGTHRRQEAEKLEQQESEAMETKAKLRSVARARAAKEQDLQRKLASHIFADRYMGPITETTMGELDREGYFADPIVLSVRSFMPWLASLTHQRTQEAGSAREAVEELFQGVVRRGKDNQRAAFKARQEKQQKAMEEARKAAAEAEEKAKRNKEVQLYIHTDIIPESPVGPIILKASSTVQQVEDAIVNWLQSNSEDAPPRESLAFKWAGVVQKDKSLVIYDLDLSTITMEKI